MAKMHGAKYIKQFARVMWKQCGMRLVVFEMHKDTKTELCIASYVFITSSLTESFLIFSLMNRDDFNRDLEGDAFEDIRPGWKTESIMEEWAHYAQSQMSTSRISIIYMPILSICSQARMRRIRWLYRLHRGKREPRWNLS
jgi:hypothetical protein